MHSVAAAGALCLLLVACTLPVPVPSREEQPGSAAPPSTSVITALEQGVFDEVNRIRYSEGAAMLRRHPALDRAARKHSHELAARGLLDHNSTDADRRTPGMRASAEGVVWSGIAENLAAMSDSGAGVPRRTGSLWLSSSGHRANMLNTTYTHTGVGIAIDRRGVWYVTQLYVLPRTSR